MSTGAPLKAGDAFVLWPLNFEKASHPKYEKLKPADEKYLKAYTILNVAGYILSPLAGIVRLITVLFQSISFYRQEFKDSKDSDHTKAKIRFLKAEAIRGVAEVFCAGLVLWIPDILMSKAQLKSQHDPIS